MTRIVLSAEEVGIMLLTELANRGRLRLPPKGTRIALSCQMRAENPDAWTITVEIEDGRAHRRLM